MAKAKGKINSNVQMMIGQIRTEHPKTKLGHRGASAMVAYSISCIHIHAGPNRQ